MIDTEIYLPGKGSQHELFRFDSANRPADGPMTLEPLSHARIERWYAPGSISAISTEYFHGNRSSEYLFLNANVQVGNRDIRELTKFLYSELLDVLDVLGYPKLLRFWNYVPDINVGEGDAENYRQFCWGRAEAFEKHNYLPSAATAVGCDDGWLRISVLSAANSVDVSYVENPRQLSAYRYPRQYGPKSPSFARATWFANEGKEMLLLSGTSSISHHETQHEGDLQAQTEETHRNIMSLLKIIPSWNAKPNTNSANKHITACKDRDTGGIISASNFQPVSMRYYLRHAAEYETAQRAYKSVLKDFPEALILKSGICRSCLSMEIEGVFESAHAYA